MLPGGGRQAQKKKCRFSSNNKSNFPLRWELSWQFNWNATARTFFKLKEREAKNYLCKTEKEIKGSINSQSLAEASVTVVVTADRSPWQQVSCSTKLSAVSQPPLGLPHTHTRTHTQFVWQAYSAKLHKHVGERRSQWQMWHKRDSRDYKSSQHGTDLCYDAESRVSQYKLLSVNWHQRKDKWGIRG